MPIDANFHVTTPWFFFLRQGVGFSSVLGKPYFSLNVTPTVQVDIGGGELAYRAPTDFVTPHAGLYSWTVQGKLQRQGQPTVWFNEKFVSNQPRIPYGPEVVTNTTASQFFDGPEGWFDGVRPATAAAARIATATRRSSPPASLIMRRLQAR